MLISDSTHGRDVARCESEAVNSGGAEPRSAADWHERLVALIADAGGFRLQEFEVCTAADVLRQAVPEALALLDRALEIFSGLLAHYEVADSPDEARDDGDFLNVVDSIVASGAGARLADLAFIGRMELNDRRDRILRLDEATPVWGMLSSCHSALRRVRKAATALERAVRDHEGLPSALDHGYVTELAHALEIRRAYAVFRKGVSGDAPQHPEEILRRLRLGAVQLAVLVGRDVYGEVRIVDRMELRRLQAAILAWLRQRDRDPLAGRRMWQDLAGFASLLAAVNRRAELREHDLAMLVELATSLQQPAVQAEEAWAAVVDCARAVWGCDDELDDLIDGADVRDLDRWRSVVAGVMDRIDAEAADGAPRAVVKDVTDIIVALYSQNERSG